MAISEKQRGEEKGSREREAVCSVTAVLVTYTVVHHHRVSPSPGKTFSVLETMRIWEPAAAADYSLFILDNLDSFPADVGGVSGVVIFQGKMGHTMILLITVN